MERKCYSFDQVNIIYIKNLAEGNLHS